MSIFSGRRAGRAADDVNEAGLTFMTLSYEGACLATHRGTSYGEAKLGGELNGREIGVNMDPFAIQFLQMISIASSSPPFPFPFAL